MRLLLASFIAVFAAAVWPDPARAENADNRPVPEPVTEAIVNPIPASDNAIAAGKRIYDRSCVTCHAEDGKGEPSMIGMLEADPPDLTDAEWTHGSLDGDLFSIIQNGTKTGMEAYKAKLNERQTWMVVHYVRSLASADGVGEAPEASAAISNPVAYTKESVSLGKQYYIRNCVECHGTDGRGHTEMVEFLLERPANLREATWKYGTKDAGVYRIIREGTPNDMPKFDEKLTEEQTWHVVNYLRSLREKG